MKDKSVSVIGFLVMSLVFLSAVTLITSGVMSLVTNVFGIGYPIPIKDVATVVFLAFTIGSTITYWMTK